jgi:hypothetical protein
VPADDDRADPRRSGVIGAAVGVAAAGVIVLLVLTGDREPDRSDPTRPRFVVPEMPKHLPGQPRPAPKDEPSKDPPAPPAKPADEDPKVVRAQTRALFETGVLSKSGLASLGVTGGLDRLAAVNGRPAGRDNFGVKPLAMARRANDGYGMKRGTDDIRMPVYSSRIAVENLVVTPVTSITNPSSVLTVRVRRHLIASARRVEACFEAKQLAGSVTLGFKVRSSRVAAAPSGTDPVASCVGDVLRLISMADTNDVDVTATFTYRAP